MADPYEEHRQIIAAAESLLAGARAIPRISVIELARRRNQLASLLRIHRLTEEREIFEPLYRSGGLEQLPQVAAALRKVQEEKTQYSADIRHWTLQAIEKDWAGYADSVAKRMTDMHRLIRFEEEHVYKPILAYRSSMRLNERVAAMR